MNSNDLLDVARDPRFISGIHNYCDRWYERCAFTDRFIGAWATLLHALPLRHNATLEILALLSRLRVDLEQEFLEAWAFVQPGFPEQ